jgi:hypothetical protein
MSCYAIKRPKHGSRVYYRLHPNRPAGPYKRTRVDVSEERSILHLRCHYHTETQSGRSFGRGWVGPKAGSKTRDFSRSPTRTCLVANSVGTCTRGTPGFIGCASAYALGSEDAGADENGSERQTGFPTMKKAAQRWRTQTLQQQILLDRSSEQHRHLANSSPNRILSSQLFQFSPLKVKHPDPLQNLSPLPSLDSAA